MDFSGIAHWIFALCSIILLYTMLFGTFRVWQVTGSFCITQEQKEADIILLYRCFLHKTKTFVIVLCNRHTDRRTDSVVSQ